MKFRSGSKQSIHQATPRKSCSVCGSTILWRRQLAMNWDSVTYCSAACRRNSIANARTESQNYSPSNPISADSAAHAA